MSWFRRKTYIARVHTQEEDFGCVPLDSIATDDLNQFETFVSKARMSGLAVECDPAWADPNISVFQNGTGE